MYFCRGNGMIFVNDFMIQRFADLIIKGLKD